MFSFSFVSLLKKKSFREFSFSIFLSEIALIARGRTFYCTIQSFFYNWGRFSKGCDSNFVIKVFDTIILKQINELKNFQWT